MTQPIRSSDIGEWNAHLEGRPPEDVVRWAAERFAANVAFATSLGLEDQMLTEIIARVAPSIPLFALDTGRLFPETLDLLAATEARYGLRIRVYFPDPADVEPLVNDRGVNLFRLGVADRKACCEARKVKPLRRALAGLQAWICGLRRGQAVTRARVDPVEWDDANGLVKINPLAALGEDDVRAHIKAHAVPHNPLHERGFPSIGCAPCTRAVGPGEDAQAGRWWWESPEHKECGLHCRPGAPQA